MRHGSHNQNLKSSARMRDERGGISGTRGSLGIHVLPTVGFLELGVESFRVLEEKNPRLVCTKLFMHISSLHVISYGIA